MELNKIFILVKKAALEFDKVSNSVLEKYGLTTPQYKVLRYVYTEADNGVRTVDLEHFYSMTHPTTIGILQNLEKKGLIRYRENPNDARSRYIVPTKKTLAMKEELEEAVNDLEMVLTDNLNARERKELISLLRKMMRL